VVLAAGSGQRFGGAVPKQYQPLGGRRVLDWSLEAARGTVDGVVLVVDAERADLAEDVDAVVVGGEQRADSVRAGLAAVPDAAEVIVVHDAARPLAGRELFARVVARVREGADGAIPTVAVTDTIKQVQGGWVATTLDRDELRAVQTPQAFRATVLRRAHEGAPQATDDARLVEAIGGRVAVVDGEQRNVKITRAEDLAIAEVLLARARQ
jgi:2-C-methyl-D-erythritol 4-phosphate cytidylyltransferase